MSRNSADVDGSVVTRLLNDAQLMSLCPDGVFFGLARQGAQAFVVLDLVTHSDVYEFQDVATEIFTYQINAVALNTSGADVVGAAVRIDQLLQDQTWSIANYYMTDVCKRLEYVRLAILDPDNTSVRWQQRGGRYVVKAAPIVVPVVVEPTYAGTLGAPQSTLGNIVPGQF
jgi:hypothetical protein